MLSLRGLRSLGLQRVLGGGDQFTGLGAVVDVCGHLLVDTSAFLGIGHEVQG